jgi:hypothetical protein
MILFPNYLDDVESYRACESFWQDVFQNASLASDDVLPDWRNGEGLALTMGGVQYDPVSAAKQFGGVSPILWKISPSSGRAVRLTHSGSSERSAVPYLEAKMDTHEWMHHNRLDVLSIYTMPSENEVKLAKMMVSTWVRRDTSLEDMKSLTERLWREGKTSR